MRNIGCALIKINPSGLKQVIGVNYANEAQAVATAHQLIKIYNARKINGKKVQPTKSYYCVVDSDGFLLTRVGNAPALFATA